MKKILISLLILASSAPLFAQNDKATVVDKQIDFQSEIADISISIPQLEIDESAPEWVHELQSKLNVDACNTIGQVLFKVSSDSNHLKIASPLVLEIHALQSIKDYQNEAFNIPDSKYCLYSQWDINANEHIVSLFQKVTLEHGTPYPLNYYTFRNYSAKNGKPFNFADVIEDKDGFMEGVVKYFCKAHRISPKSTMGESGLYYELSNLPFPKEIGLSKKGIVAIYQPNEVAPYIHGATAVIIPFSALKDVFDSKFFDVKSARKGNKTLIKDL